MAMNNVFFKHGSQASLDAITTSVDGAFYLTDDTHRLYIGNGAKPALLSQAIITVNDIASLPSGTAAAEGQFYYVKTDATAENSHKGNILCVYTGGKWVQINPDTNTVTTLSDVATSVSSSAANKVVFTTTVSTTKDGATAESDSGTVTIQGADGIVAKVNGAALELQGTTYTLGLASGKDHTISLAKGGAGSGTAGEIALTAGNNIQLTDSTGAIAIAADSWKIDSITSSALAQGFDVTVATKNVDGVSGAESTGASKSLTAKLDPQIKLASDSTAIHFVNGVATLNVYSKSEVDAELQKVDAMRYMGTVSTAAELSGLTNVANGDTYKVAAAFGDYHVNDILIAKGTETNGVITSGLEWNVIHSGDGSDTHYNLALKNGKIFLQEEAKTDKQSIEIVGGNKLTATPAVSGNAITVTVDHDAVTTGATTGTAVSNTSSAAAGTKVSVVTGVSNDGYGHVSSVETTEVTLLNYDVSDVKSAITVSAASDVATIRQQVEVDTTSGAKKQSASGDAFKLASTSLNIVKDATDATQVNVNLVWGTF